MNPSPLTLRFWKCIQKLQCRFLHTGFITRKSQFWGISFIPFLNIKISLQNCNFLVGFAAQEINNVQKNSLWLGVQQSEILKRFLLLIVKFILISKIFQHYYLFDCNIYCMCEIDSNKDQAEQEASWIFDPAGSLELFSAGKDISNSRGHVQLFRLLK